MIDTIQEPLETHKLVELCEGNPGAITVLIKIRMKYPELLTDKFYQNAKAAGLTGSALWVLYKKSGFDINVVCDKIEKIP